MEGSDPLFPAQPLAKKRRKETPDFEKGEPRAAPCKLCVDCQLKNFKQGGWKDTCSDQRTKKGKSTACYQCRIAGKSCRPFDIDDPVIEKWAEVQRQPENYDSDEAFDAASEMKLYLLGSAEPLTPVEKSFCQTLKTMSDSACATMAVVDDLVHNHLTYVDDDNADNHVAVPGEQAGLDPDYQEKLNRLFECRKLGDALPLAAEIIGAASSEIKECLQNVRGKL